VKTGDVSKNKSGTNFQARVQGLYGQSKGPNKEQNFMLLAKKCNWSVPVLEVMEPCLQNNKLYRVERSILLVDDGVPSQTVAFHSHGTLQKWYEHVEQPEMDRVYIELTKEWNSQKV